MEKKIYEDRAEELDAIVETLADRYTEVQDPEDERFWLAEYAKMCSTEKANAELLLEKEREDARKAEFSMQMEMDRLRLELDRLKEENRHAEAEASRELEKLKEENRHAEAEAGMAEDAMASRRVTRSDVLKSLIGGAGTFGALAMVMGFEKADGGGIIAQKILSPVFRLLKVG